MNAGSQRLTGAANDAEATIRRVMVVDDSPMQRKIICATLAGFGLETVEAASGTEALDICTRLPVDLVLSDWMMPGMSGVEFCRAFRALPREHYGYFILLTSRRGKQDVAEGLQAGADDFLTKPVNGEELRARISAGERILCMERELVEKNRRLSSALGELQTLYEGLDRDLQEARRLQQALVPEGAREFGRARVSLMLRSSGHVGGDLVGCYPIDARRIGLYAVDVSGHGVASALMTARLASILGGAAPEQNVALRRLRDGSFTARAPHHAAARLNQQFLGEGAEQYFTLLLAEFDTHTGRGSMVQAGHPHPAVQRADGTVRYIGGGGLPVALLDGAKYRSVGFRLAPGERLLIHSDGLTECPLATGGMLGDEGLTALLLRHHDLGGPELLATLDHELRLAAAQDLPDDLSAVLLEYRAPPG